MADNKVLIKIEGDIKGLQKSLDTVQKNIQGLEKSTGGSIGSIGGAFTKLGSIIGGAIALDKIKDIGLYALQSASDVEEMENKFNVVFKSMGGEIDKWAEGFASAIGRTKSEIKTGVANLGDLLTGYGMTEKSASDLSQKVIELSYDLASFNNVQDADAIDRMTKGILGEHEGLKALGISLNETNLQAKMMEMGLSGQFAKLDEVTKAQVRWAVMLDQTKNAQGDAVRSADAYANSTKNLKAQIQQVAENFGKELLPLATEIVHALIPVVKDMIPIATEMGKVLADGIRKGIDAFQEIGQKIQEVSKWMAEHKLEVTAIALVIGTLATAIGLYALQQNMATISTWAYVVATDALAVAKGKLSKVAKGLGTAIKFLKSPFGLTSLAIMAVIAVGYLLIKNWDKISAWAKTFAETVKNAIVTGFNWCKDKIIEIWNNVTTFIQTAWDFICNIVSFGIQLIVSIISGAIQLITMPFRMIWEVCKSIAMAVWSVIGGFITGAIQFIANIIITYITGVLNFWKMVFTAIYNVVLFIFNGIQMVISTVMTVISTIISTVWNVIKTVISTVLSVIFNYIKTRFEMMKAIITTVLNVIKAVVSTVWNAIKSVITTILNVIKSIVQTVFNAIKSVVTSVSNAIKGVVSSVWNAIKGVFTTVGNGIKSVVTGVFNGIKSTITGVMNTIKGVVQGAWNTLKNIFNTVLKPNIKLPHIKISGKFSLNPPQVPKLGIDWYQTGGIFTGASVIGVGENGDEAVVPLSNKRRMKPFASAVASMIGADKTSNGGGGNTTIHIDQMVVRDDTDIKKIAQELDKLAKRDKRKKGEV